MRNGRAQAKAFIEDARLEIPVGHIGAGVELMLNNPEIGLLQSQKMDAVGKLAAGVVHDLNNLLAIIRGASSVLKDELPANSSWLREADDIEKAVDAAAALTRQLLSLARPQSVKSETLDLNEVLVQLSCLLKRFLGDAIELDVATDEGPALVRMDRSQLEQVLVNLAVNARDAMSEGGRLILNTCRCQLGAGDYVVLRVSDTGSGMAPETMERIFEPFFTTKPVTKGTGLGLATVADIVGKARGSVDVDSKLGEGTTFSILLPYVENGSGRESTSEASGPMVLVVESDLQVLRLVSRCLETAGYRVTGYRDGKGPLALEPRGLEEFDLILTGVVLPGMSGPELVDGLVSNGWDKPVVFLSDYGPCGHLEGNAQPSLCLDKPFSPTELLNTVSQALEAPTGFIL